MTKNYIDSYYTATATGLCEPHVAKSNYRCNVCVIGAGFTGISTALHLAESGRDVIVLEARRIGWGASGRNGGQLHSGQRKGQKELENLFGRERAHALWQLAEESKAMVKDRISRHNIECGFKSGLLHAAYKKSDLSDFKSEISMLQDDYGYKHVRYVSKEEMSEMLGTEIYHGGILDDSAGHLHPLNYVLGLSNAARQAGVRIFEYSPATEITQSDPGIIKTNQATITADHLVIACNGYLEKLNKAMAARIMPINNFIIATEPLGNERATQLIRDDVAVADTKFVVDY